MYLSILSRHGDKNTTLAKFMKSPKTMKSSGKILDNGDKITKRKVKNLIPGNVVKRNDNFEQSLIKLTNGYD